MTLNEFHKIEKEKLESKIEVLENILLNIRSKILSPSSDITYLVDLIDETLEK